MINILYALNGVFHKGGTEAVILNYFDHIDKNRFHIDFLVHGNRAENRDNETHKYLESCGSRLFYVTPRGESYFANTKEIKKILTENRFDIVHSHMDAAGAFFLKQAKKAGVSVRVAHSHNTAHQIHKGGALKDAAYRFILDRAVKGVRKYANLNIACSKEAGDWLFGDKGYVVLNNAIDADKYLYNDAVRAGQRRQYGLEGKTVIGHVGRFSEQKNHRFLVEIFDAVCRQNDDAMLMLVGSGRLETEIKAKISEYGLNGRTLFMGDRSDVYALMQAMDVFVLPSLFEGLPVVGIEAQAAGLPCVISDTVSKDVKITQNVAFMRLDNTPEAWAGRIINMSAALRVNTKDDIIASGYDIRNVVERLENMYREKLTTCRAGRI
jgi:glycosyltransferase involved in cell wall biosynthesis